MIRLLGDGIIVKRAKEREGLGLIIIPQSALDRNRHPMFRAIVLAVGPGRWNGVRGKRDVFVETRLKPGDQVLVGKHGATNVRQLGDDVFVMSERDVVALLEPEEGDAEAAAQ